VPAERLAALRIGVGIVLLLDILVGYLPRATDFFGAHSLGGPEVFAQVNASKWRWSIFCGLDSNPGIMHAALLGWAIAALGLTLGVLPRLNAAIAWALSISFLGANWYLHNSGDNVRTIELFYLMLTPCGAVWSLTSRWSASDQEDKPGSVYVPAWPVRLLFLQMMAIYFFNGLYKLLGHDWRAGDVMHYVMANVAWTRVSYAQFPMPFLATQILGWIVLTWELGFPVLVMMPSTRKLILWLGIAFHIGTGIFLPLGPFPLYMLCLYLPLVPWECYLSRGAGWIST
jgi:hypothetical protein